MRLNGKVKELQQEIRDLNTRIEEDEQKVRFNLKFFEEQTD